MKGKQLCLSFDCSGFVQFYFLQLCKAHALAEIKAFLCHFQHLPPTQIKRFYAADFVSFLRAEQPKQFWEKVNPNSLQRNDLIVYASDSPKSRGRHCMLVSDVEKKDENEIHLFIVDSTKHQHLNDTRSVGQTGIGRGKIILYQNQLGQWNRFLWRRHVYERDLFFARIKE